MADRLAVFLFVLCSFCSLSAGKNGPVPVVLWHGMGTFSFHLIFVFCSSLIGQVGKELFCVKKSILVTFSVLIISLCEVNTSVFNAMFLPN